MTKPVEGPIRISCLAAKARLAAYFSEKASSSPKAAMVRIA